MKRISLEGTYLGFTDNLKPLQKGKVEKTLDNLIRVDGTVMTEKEFIYSKLKQGYVPYIEENYSYYSKRLDEYTKPRNDYRIKSKTDDSFYSITKTAYDFAHHIIDNGFLDIEKTKQFIQEEQHKKEELEQLEKERLQKEREEVERKRKQEEQERKERLERKEKEWQAIGKKLFTDEVEKKLANVLNSYWSEIKEIYNYASKNELLKDMKNKFINILGNYNYVDYWIKYYVKNHNDVKNNPYNMVEREFLLNVFNISMSDHVNTITAKVKAFYKGKEYKGNNNSNIKTFHAFSFKDNNYEQVIGEEIKIDNFSFFIVKNDTKSYDIYELKSGAKLSDGYTNKKDTIKKINELVVSKKEQIEKAIEVFIKNNGYSPNVQKQTI